MQTQAKPIRIAYDIKLMQPGCVLIQAGLGCDTYVAHQFPVGSWLTNLTPDMRRYEITESQLEQLIDRTKITEKK